MIISNDDGYTPFDENIEFIDLTFHNLEDLDDITITIKIADSESFILKRELVSFDWALKHILREKANFVVLEGLLSELLSFDVLINDILESEGNVDGEKEKFNRVDLLCKNLNNELILIEVQYSSEVDYFQRMLYGTSKLTTEYIKKGEAYENIKKVYSVNIVYFDIGQGSDYLYCGKTEFTGFRNGDLLGLSTNQKKKFNLSSVHQIYPEYYIIKVNNFDNIAKSSIDEWIYFLKNSDIKSEFKAKGIKEANEKMDYLKLDENKKLNYRRSQENKMFQRSMEESHQFIGYNRGLKEGEVLGKLEIAKNLLDVLDVETISIKTNLSVEEIEKLKAELS